MSIGGSDGRKLRQQFVLMPKEGFRSSALRDLEKDQESLVKGLTSGIKGLTSGIGLQAKEYLNDFEGIRIVHSSREDGVKLAELTSDEAIALRYGNADVQAYPLVYYELAQQARIQVSPPVQPASAKSISRIELRIPEQILPRRSRMQKCLPSRILRVGWACAEPLTPWALYNSS